MTSAEPVRVGVVGTGLIGCSIAMAAGRAGDVVRGFDEDPAVLDEAAARTGLEAAPSMEESVRDGAVVFVCTPVDSVAKTAARCLAAGGASVVTDVGSVKKKILDDVETLVPPSDLPRFVGGHPMGGSERTGPDGASASLVEGVAWVLTPGPWTAPASVATLDGYVQRLGAHPVIMDAERHDRLVAVVSHLPQVVSSALMALVSGDEVDDPSVLTLAAGGFRDVTRLAGSDPKLWAGILDANREALLEAIDRYVDRLRAIRGLAAEGSIDELEGVLAEAQEARAALGAKPRVRAGMALLQISVPDQPGVLAQLTAALGEGDVNIEDLQIVHSPWEPSGVVHVTVLADRADAALGILGAGGFQPVRVA